MVLGDIDSKLIAQLNESDESAFELIFHQYYSQLCNYAISYVKKKSEVEDIVQSVFLNFIGIVKKGLKFKSICEIRSYLYKAVRNSCLNYIRDNNRRLSNQIQCEINNVKIVNNIEIDIIRNDILEIIYKAIKSLPDSCRRIFIHSYIDDWSDKKIAETYHISVNTIKTQKSRAKKKLRGLLGNLIFTD